jgi:hypothetical protein
MPSLLKQRRFLEIISRGVKDELMLWRGVPLAYNVVQP